MKENLKLLISFSMNKIVRLCLLMLIFGIIDYSCIAAEAAAGDFDDRRPAEHLCPITLHVMADPVVAADGRSYERGAILQHLERYDTSPATGLMLRNKELFENQALKIMIQEWRPGRYGEPSALETRDASSIAKQVKEEFRKNADLLNSANGQNIVAFLGNTGAGKSTLVNLLAGKKIKPSEDGEDYILADPDDASAMVIGTGGDSETLYPKSIDVGNLRFFDLPGFNDTDGSERNLVNAAFTRKILLDAASVRLVFVVGQDQFTADRSASVKQMFNCLKQLFVADQVNLVDEGVFVATKITCNEKTDLIEFLLRKASSKDKAELSKQLTSWNERNKLGRMFHPRVDSNQSVMDQLLGLIQQTRPVKVHGINVSALYPPDTKRPLERMFVSVLEEALGRYLNAPLLTLSDFDEAVSWYSSTNFWQEFNVLVCREDDAISLVKELCINPYNQALRKVETMNEKRRQLHIFDLIEKRKARVAEIERATDAKTQAVILSIVPREERDDGNGLVSFYFTYQKDFYIHVCGSESILDLTADTLEHEVVRRRYADFMARHNHAQMARWYENFSKQNIKDVDTAQEIENLREELAVEKQSAAQNIQKAAQESEGVEKKLVKLEQDLQKLMGNGG